jgi:ERCC4-type nuclease
MRPIDCYSEDLRIAIEFKNIADLADTIINKGRSINNQLLNLIEMQISGWYCALIIYGNELDWARAEIKKVMKYSKNPDIEAAKKRKASMIKAMNTIKVDAWMTGISVMNFATEEFLFRALVRVSKEKRPGYTPKRQTTSQVASHAAYSEPVIQFYMNIPNTGQERAFKLWESFPRPADLLAASPVEINKALGLKKKKAKSGKAIYKFLHGE